MPLPIGTWNINADGFTGSLIVGSDGSGGFNGTVFGDPIVGYFDETSQTFTFMRLSGGGLTQVQTYHGNLFKVVQTQNVGGTITQTTTFTLTGDFQTFPATGTVNVFAWFAQIVQQVKEKEGSKDNKDNPDKMHKDAKDVADHKNPKEGAVDKIRMLPELLPSAQTGMAQTADVSTMVNHLMLRLSAIEQQLASGRSFIAAAERPPVGQQALDTPSHPDDTANP
jgi:hypothetical protein